MESPDVEFSVPCRALRQPVVVNGFKQYALGRAHLPGEDQTREVVAAFEARGFFGVLDSRTWKGWFGSPGRRARVDGVRSLDRFVDVVQAPDRVAHDGADPECRTFRDLLCAGLVVDLLKRINAKDPLMALTERALRYQARSPLHLHVDALESVALSGGIGDVPWHAVKAIAARRIQGLLHARWSPRGGTVFPLLKARVTRDPGRTRLSVAQDSGARKPSQWCPDLAEVARATIPQPAWSAIGVLQDVPPDHVSRLLLAISADHHFLTPERIDAWALDLATSALAGQALAWSDRYRTFGALATPEMVFWGAFDTMFFTTAKREQVADSVDSALSLIGLKLTRATEQMVWRARRSYRRQMAQLGLRAEVIAAVVRRCSEIHPVRFEHDAAVESLKD